MNFLVYIPGLTFVTFLLKLFKYFRPKLNDETAALHLALYDPKIQINFM